MENEAQIVIVGAGPTGLTLACQLWRRGVRCRIVDRSDEPTNQSRAIGLSARSLEVLDEFGAAADLLDHGVPCRGATFYSRGRKIGGLSFSSTKHTKYPFMLALPQSDTERVLEQHLRRLGGEVERGTEVQGLSQEPDQVAVHLAGPAGPETALASWVVGTDGAHSTVRKESGIGFTGSATEDVFVSVDAFVADGPPHGDGHYYFFPGGLAVIVGLPDKSHRLTALIRTSHEEDGDLENRDIEALISRGVGKDLSIQSLRDAGWGISDVRINTRIATSFRAGRCLLAGDAAHIFGPVGGQGMNTGVQDAQNLAWKLTLVSRGQARSVLLDSYHEERRRVALDAQHHAGTQATLATVRSKAAVLLRDKIFTGLTKCGLVDRKIGPSVTQLALNYGGSGMISRGHVGRRIPDTPLGDSRLSSSLFSLLTHGMFTLLLLDGGEVDAAKVTWLSETVPARFGELVVLRTISKHPGSTDGAIDHNGALHEHLGVKGPSVCLVRPDLHIDYLGPIEGGSNVVTELARRLPVPTRIQSKG